MAARLLYVLACLLVPILWGSAVFAIARRLERKRPPGSGPAAPDIDYYI